MPGSYRHGVTDASTPRPPLLRLTLVPLVDEGPAIVVAADVRVHCHDADDMAAMIGAVLRVAADLAATALGRGDLTPDQLSELVEDSLDLSDERPRVAGPPPGGPPRFPGVL